MARWSRLTRLMGRLLPILAVLVALFPSVPPAQAAGSPIVKWVSKYNSAGDDFDGAVAMAVDASGNVYVTGESGPFADRDYATVKYDSNGNQLWVARYNGGDVDLPVALAVDNRGNVYVTGRSLAGSLDYATVKYDPSGAQLWATRYDGPVNGGEYATALAVDASGNVYVTGSSPGPGDNELDYATVKYDSNGSQLWVARYNGPGDILHHHDDQATAVAVDGEGNVYVVGESLGDFASGYDYATVKYNSAGYQLWVSRYHGEAGDDRAFAVALDMSGNVYTSGASTGRSTGSDYATVKYDSNGSQLWAARYNGSGNSTDGASALAVDPSGNAYVTGIATGTNRDYATVKYDADGHQQWAAVYNGSSNGDDQAVALGVDGAGSVYVTGWITDSYGSRDYATLKYDGAGNELWVAVYPGTSSGHEDASDLCVDADGNVYVTGKVAVGFGASFDYATIKYFSESRVPFTPGEGAVTLDPLTAPAVTVRTSLILLNAGYRVDAWGTVTKTGGDYRADATISRWTGPSAQGIKHVDHTYDLGVVASGSYNFKFYSNGILIKTVPFVVSSSAERPAGDGVAITGLSVLGLPYAGKAGRVQVVVENRGKSTATFAAELFADGKVVGKIMVKDLAPGKSRKLNLRWMPAAPGEVTLAVVVKSDGISALSGAGVRLEQKVAVLGLRR